LKTGIAIVVNGYQAKDGTLKGNGRDLTLPVLPMSRVAMIILGNSANPLLPGVGLPVSSRGTRTHS
jgi:hypothetical protein